MSDCTVGRVLTHKIRGLIAPDTPDTERIDIYVVFLRVGQKFCVTTVILLVILLSLGCGFRDSSQRGTDRGMMRGGTPMGPMMGDDMPMGPGMMGTPALPPPERTPLPTATPGGPATVSYHADIQPIFDANCVSCHGGSAELWLESYEQVMAGSQNGPVVMPNAPSESELYLRITGEKEPIMPLGAEPLRRQDVERIRTWIAEGAPNN